MVIFHDRLFFSLTSCTVCKLHTTLSGSFTQAPVVWKKAMCYYGFSWCSTAPLSLLVVLLQVSSGYLVVVFVYVTEFTGSKVRTWTSMHIHAFFAVGIMVVALTGYLVRVWWIYQIILSLCTSPFLLVCWMFPETPFYLISTRRYQEAQTLLDSVARFNGLDHGLKVEELLAPEATENGKSLLEETEAQPSRVEKQHSILDLFGTWRMAGRTCTVWAIWFIGSLGYYVFSLGSVNLGGNQYMNLFLVGK